MFSQYKKPVLHNMDETPSTPAWKKPIVQKAIGLVLLLVSVSVFAQGIPFMFLFIAAYMGLPVDATVGDMNSVVWLLTSVTMMIVALYAFHKWSKFLVARFISKKVAPNPPLALAKKGKHTHA